MFDKLNYEDFREILNTDFQVADIKENVKLRLFEISEKKETPQTVCFSLLLKSPADYFLEQKNYDLHHEKLGEGSMFIVPIRQDADGFVYEALFNRYVEA